MNQSAPAPVIRKDIAPEIPPEVQRRMDTERKVWSEPGAPEGGGFHDPLQALIGDFEVSEASVRKARRAIIAACKSRKIPVDDEGMPLPLTLPEGKMRALLAKQYPGAPAMSPELGDLTPAFVEWLYLHDPQTAATRYYGRGNHLTA